MRLAIVYGRADQVRVLHEARRFAIYAARVPDPATLRYILAHGCSADLDKNIAVAAQHGNNVRTVRFLRSRLHLDAPTLIQIKQHSGEVSVMSRF